MFKASAMYKNGSMQSIFKWIRIKQIFINTEPVSNLNTADSADVIDASWINLFAERMLLYTSEANSV